MMSPPELEDLDPSLFFKVKTIKEKVFEILNKHPDIQYEALYYKFPHVKKNTIQVYRREWNQINTLGNLNIALLRQCVATMIDFIKYKTKYNVSNVAKADREALDTLEKFVRGEKI